MKGGSHRPVELTADTTLVFPGIAYSPILMKLGTKGRHGRLQFVVFLGVEKNSTTYALVPLLSPELSKKISSSSKERERERERE